MIKVGWRVVLVSFDNSDTSVNGVVDSVVVKNAVVDDTIASVVVVSSVKLSVNKYNLI